MRRATTALKRLSLPQYSTRRQCSSTPIPTAIVPTNARLRFAPSPTGFLHLGGLRTALFNHLLARKWKGKWILRVEDTDRSRLVDGAVDSLRNTLDWAGLNHDEGVGAGGSHGPYIQSERLDLYQDYAKRLLTKDQAYECFCTPDELKSIKMGIQKSGHSHGYDGRCRNLTDEERGRRKRAGQPYIIRFKSSIAMGKLPADLVYGDVQFPTMAIPDDFVILKSDGWPTYHLANVVDDHFMEISHVLRGEEWLPSVPKHHALYEAFGWVPPNFAHLPLLVNADGTKLSKRFGNVHVERYRENGYEPEALLNFLALMGWDHHSALETMAQQSSSTTSTTSHSSSDFKATSDSDSASSSESAASSSSLRSDLNSYSEIFSIPQLTAAFSLDHINHKKAAVNMSKLDFINKMTLRRKAGRLGKDDLLIDAGKEVLGVSGGEDVEKSRKETISRLQGMLREEKALKGNERVEDLDYVEKVFDAELPRTVLLKDIAMSSIFLFIDSVDYDNQESQMMLKTINGPEYVRLVQILLDELRHMMDASEEMLEDMGWEAINSILSQEAVKAKSELLTPLRHALTARKKGPSVPTIMSVLGKDRTFERLEAGLAYMRKRIRGTD